MMYARFLVLIHVASDTQTHTPRHSHEMRAQSSHTSAKADTYKYTSPQRYDVQRALICSQHTTTHHRISTPFRLLRVEKIISLAVRVKFSRRASVC